MAPACKEWAAIVHALLEGEQILDVRKGGLREDGRHFSVQANRLWLYPTAEHQKAELLKEPYRHWIDLARRGAGRRADHDRGLGRRREVATITEAEQLDAIASKLIWTDDYAASRLGWKKRDPLWVLALRVHRLVEPVTVPWADAYGGCTSWVELQDLPDDPASLPSEPALSDVAFEARLKGSVEALPRSPILRRRPRSVRAVACGWYPRLRASSSVSGANAANRSDARSSAIASWAPASSVSRSYTTCFRLSPR